jgi:hypothetical protein
MSFSVTSILNRHLTAHSTDPFTGLPLSIHLCVNFVPLVQLLSCYLMQIDLKDVVPNQMLKRQTEGYIVGRKRKRQNFESKVNETESAPNTTFKPFSGTGYTLK